MFLLVSCKPEETNTNPSSYVFDAPVLYGSPKHLSEDNPLTIEGIDLGRHLFYDPILSIDYSLSCSSCHNQKFGFSDTAKLSKGVNGQRTDRHSMAISNTAWQNAFFWDGRVATLEEQALKPIQHPKEMGLALNELVKRLKASEMYVKKFQCAFPGQEIDSINVAKAIAQFEQTLVSSNSRYDQYKLGLLSATAQEKRGERLFFTHPEEASGIRGGNCGDCHSGTLTFSNNFANNGLDEVSTDKGRENVTGSSNDRGKFKIVSLRNIEVTGPYMHDGRFSTLEDVLDHYNEHIQSSQYLDKQILDASNNPPPFNTSLGLMAQEKADIVAFLKMLTDKQFLENEKFSSPFKK